MAAAGLGLTSAEAAARLVEHGPNVLPVRRPRSWASRVLAQLRDPMIGLLLAAAAVTIALGDVTDTLVIALVVVLNTTIGVVQEVRADRAIAELDRLAAPLAHAVRDGAVREVPGPDLVPDDVVRLGEGDVVPADLRILEAHALQVDESAMTGESQPVDRGPEEELASGTVVTRGRAVGVVVRTGADSGLGQIAALIASTAVVATPLQQRLRRLSRELVLVVLAAAAVVFALGLLRGREATEMLVTAVSLAVAAVPESLPAVVSVALALGAHRMARRHALVRRLPAVETLGSVTVLASDKTGTLTEGRMVATEVWLPDSAGHDVTGQGYAPFGSVMGVDDAAMPALTVLVRDAALCNDAHLVAPREPDDGWSAVGDPLEAALVALAGKSGLDVDAERERWPRDVETPFEAERGWMSTVHHSPSGGLTILKGAPETVLAMVDDQELVSRARLATEDLAGRGCRVIAVAEVAGRHRLGVAGAPPLRLVGLVGVTDPPRAASRAVVEACAAAGIRVVLVTGDHPVTARVIASEVGVCEPGAPVVTGDQVVGGQAEADLDRVAVYARVRPDQKVHIVNELQRRGHVVAMTGDGVNDAPALRSADIGVAMGKGGTEVARQAADLVLADDDLGTVVAAVEEGRRVYANIRSFLRYAVSGGLAEVLVMLAGPFLGMPLPLLPAQILWINMLTHGLPGVAFGAEPAAADAMAEPSRSPKESVLGGGLAREIGAIGTVIALVSLLAAAVADAADAHLQTSVFVTLGLAQLGVALALRAHAPRGWRQRGLELAVVAAAGLQLLGVYAGPFQELLSTEALPALVLAELAALSVVPGAVVHLVRARRPAARKRVAGDLRP